MALTVEIDPGSGFCGGVIRAIGKAEEFLKRRTQLYSLGTIVHNEAEVERLSAKGLVTLEKKTFESRPKGTGSGETMLIRAHGEPPETYVKAKETGFSIIDCTCPVVLRLQRSIREAYTKLHRNGGGGQILIFGKIGHAEVLGLVGQTGGDALVIESKEMLQQALQDGRISLRDPIDLFSQTTANPVAYAEICALLEEKMAAANASQPQKTGWLQVHHTICAQVASRHAKLTEFARSHDLLVFVSGKFSSNGKVLYNLCKSVNPRTYHIVSPEELDCRWFLPDDRAGICGATSTPKWLLEQVADAILAFNQT